jgi:hypothetical protein
VALVTLRLLTGGGESDADESEESDDEDESDAERRDPMCMEGILGSLDSDGAVKET